MPEPLSQVEIETQLLRLADMLADVTEEYRDLCDATSQAEMDAKHAFHTAVVMLAGEEKMTADVRKARAWLAAEGDERGYATLAAGKEACRESMRTLTTRIEALRTVSANVRRQV